MENLKLETLALHHKNKHVLMVTLNRPEVRNAINSVMMKELRDLWQALYVDAAQIRCVVLTGEGSAFCAGADLKERKNLPLKVWQSQHGFLEQAMLAMLDCPIPIIAAVNGAAFGGGLELILASDFAYAADSARFAQSEVKIGIMPGALGTQHLPRACGLNRAKEIAMTGADFSAAEAADWGIINKVCAIQHLMDDVMAVANRICENAPLSVRQVKKALNLSQQVDIKSGFIFELESYYRLLPHKDRIEGINAFNEKRKANFTGE